jgi:cholesterol transport system auxiliary component
MKRRFILAAPLGLAACGSLLPAQKYVPTTVWPLAPPPPPLQPVNQAGPVLLVRDLSAAPGLNDQSLHTLRVDGSLEISYYNRWAVPPADAATAALAAWAEASGVFSAVVAPGSRLTPGLIIEGELSEFVADTAARQARAVLTLVVIRNAGTAVATARPLAQSRITGSAPLAGLAPPALVAAQRAALANALAQAVALLTSCAAGQAQSQDPKAR